MMASSKARREKRSMARFEKNQQKQYVTTTNVTNGNGQSSVNGSPSVNTQSNGNGQSSVNGSPSVNTQSSGNGKSSVNTQSSGNGKSNKNK